MTKTVSSQPVILHHHHHLLRLGIWIELATILCMTIEACVALFVGFHTPSHPARLWDG